ncbi:MAG: hypothetical protein WCK01_00065 [Candidatus Uhrbacteria bacterium]
MIFPGISNRETLRFAIATGIGMSICLFIILEMKGENAGNVVSLLLWPSAYWFERREKRKYPERKIIDPLPPFHEYVFGILGNMKMGIVLGAGASAVSWGLLILVFWLAGSGYIR